MADDSVYADLLDELSPITKLGIDPDAARMDRAGTMARLMGTDASQPALWYQQGEQDDAEEPQQQEQPQQQQKSPNGNVLPPGLQSREPQTSVLSAPTIPNVATKVDSGAPLSQGRQTFEPADGVKPAVPGAVTPSGNTTKSELESENKDTLSTQAAVYKSAADQEQQLLKQPDLDTVLAPDRAKLAADTARANASPYVPGTTHLLPNYKPSLGQRIVRGVDGFARGGILGIVDPTIGGGAAYGSPNNLFRGQVGQATKDAATDASVIASKLASWKEQRLAKRADASALGALATTGKNVAAANQAQQDQPNKDSDAAARTSDAAAHTAEAFNNSPTGKSEAAKEINAQTIASREAQLKDPKNPLSKSTRADQAYFVATGRMPDPDRYHTPPEQVRYNQAAEADAASHPPGWRPSVEDIMRYAAAAKGEEPKAGRTADDAEGDVSALVNDSVGKKEEYAAQFDRNPADGSYSKKDGTGQITGQQYDGRIDQFRKDLNVKLAKKGWRMDEQGNVAPLHEPKRSAPPSQVSAPANPSAATKGVVTPPASLLRSTPEGGSVYGKGGEVFTKQGGKWVQQP